MPDEKQPKTLEERIRFAARQKDWSLRQWSLRAGLSSGYLGSLVTRLGQGGEGKGVTKDTIHKLAVAAGISEDWLTSGEGAAERVVELDDPLPERTAAAVFARSRGVREDAVQDVIARSQKTTRRLTPDEWLTRMTHRAWEMDEAEAGRGEPGWPATHEIPEPPKKKTKR